MSPCLMLICAIIIMCIEESRRKSSQPKLTRYMLVSLQIVCTVVSTLVVLIFFSDVLKASRTQINILGPLICVTSYLICAQAFRRK